MRLRASAADFPKNPADALAARKHVNRVPPPDSFTACHIGDLHFWSVPLNPAAYLGKRILGVGNLVARRARKFRMELAPALVARLAEQHAEYYLFSGDFSTTALPEEFRRASEELRPLWDGSPGRILAVPGNHDRYTRESIASQTFERHLHLGVPQAPLPSFHELGDGVWLWRLDAGTSNGMNSFGRVKESDLLAFDEWHARDGARVRELWLLCHFPMEDPTGPLCPTDRPQELRNAEPLLERLRAFGRPVIQLHGHHHHRWAFRSAASGVLYLNAGAPLMRRGGEGPDLGFLELTREGGRTSLIRHVRDEVGTWWATSEGEVALGEVRDLQHG